MKVRKLIGQNKNSLTSEGKTKEEREKINAADNYSPTPRGRSTHPIPEQRWLS